MADVIPFQALRPKEEFAACVSTLPYDVYSETEARAVIEANPLSFLAVTRPEAALGNKISDLNRDIYRQAAGRLTDYVQKGIYIQDELPGFYVYRLIRFGQTHTGIVGLASVDDYLSQIIRKHENTRTDKELDRIRHIQACHAQTGPVFLAYRADASIKEIICQITEQKPVYDFTCEDNIRHQVWCIFDTGSIKELQKHFSRQDRLYIADGHHRCAAAVRFALMQRALYPKHTKAQAFNYILSVFFQEDELTVMDYNRVVDSLGGYDEDTFLKLVSNAFFLTKLGTRAKRPACKGQITMYLKDTWYLLEVRNRYDMTDPVRALDVSILQEQLLEPILHIKDPKTDPHIDFVGGIRGLSELERRVHTDMKVAFALYPTDIGALFCVADHGLLMPPKSTWFEPKLRSGLFIHTI